MKEKCAVCGKSDIIDGKHGVTYKKPLYPLDQTIAELGLEGTHAHVDCLIDYRGRLRRRAAHHHRTVEEQVALERHA